MKTNHISVAKTARYFTHGAENSEIKNIWFVLHGYGHLADRFLQKFESLDNGKNLIVSPEGLSRFYLEGSAGRVGASWMTKEDRLCDINDYVNYLNALYNEIRARFTDTVKIHILGFSQGAATASRWIQACPFKASSLILWSGAFPPDLDFEIAANKLKDVKVYIIYGTQDEMLKEDVFKKQIKKINTCGIEPNIMSFEGGHEIHLPTLKALTKALHC